MKTWLNLLISRDQTLSAKLAPASTCRRDAGVKALHACSGEETHTVWARRIKRLIHRYLEDRNKRRALRRVSAENKTVPLEGRRWCDATERELIGDIMNIHGWRRPQ